jgi:1,4-dihydroxy-2-naphthoyl-CoA hydrolase
MASIWHGGEFPLAALNGFPSKTLVTHLGIELTEAGDDWLKGRMPVDERTRQYAGILHGGASVAFAETLASAGCFFTLDSSRQACAGMEINANHIRPVSSGWVTGVATRESAGKTTQVWTIRITDEAGKLVCLSRCTMAVISTT